MADKHAWVFVSTFAVALCMLCKRQIDAMQRESGHMWSTHHIWLAVLLVHEPVLLTGLFH